MIVPVYELEKESKIKDVVETVENPFDIAKNEFLGTDSRSAKKRKRLRDKEKEFNDISDSDLKRELANGQPPISNSNFMPIYSI